MAFDPTPWFIGGGAEHSPAVARALAFAATGGKEGIISPGDLKVSALGSPGGSVEIAAGSAVIVNRSAGGAQQSYVMRAPSTTGLPVPPAGAGGRSDLVLVRVEDPEFAPWAVPNDPVAAQYVKPFLLQGVPAGTTDASELNLGYSAIALARIDLPSNVAAVSSGMVTDVRKLAQARTSREVFTGPPAAANVALASAAITPFPNYQPQLVVPDWATNAVVLVHITSLGRVSGDTTGTLRAQLGAAIGNELPFNYEGTAGDERVTALVVGDLNVRAMQGRTQTLVVSGKRLTGPGHLKTLSGTRVVFDVHFTERVV